MNKYDSVKMADVLGDVKNKEMIQNPVEAGVLLHDACPILAKVQEKVFSRFGW